MTSTIRGTIPRFSLAERDRRWELANDFMERRGLDALLVYGEHENAGATPVYFDTWFTNEPRRCWLRAVGRQADGAAPTATPCAVLSTKAAFGE